MLDGENRVVMVGGTDPSKDLGDFAMQSDIANMATKGEVEIDDGTNAPSAANAEGTKGTVVVTDSYIYVCVDTDTWKRAALSTWT